MVVLWAGMALAASPTTITLQNGVDGYTGASDAQIGNSGSADFNFGGSTGFDAYQFSYFHDFALIRFDLSSLKGKAATVTSAELLLTQAPTSVNGGRFPFELHAISAANAGWVQGTSKGAVETDGAATYNNKASFGPGSESNVPWAGGEGLGDGTNGGYDPAVLGKGMYDYSKGNQVIRIPLEAGAVQKWIDGDNAGMILIVPNTGNSDKEASFFSSEDATAANRPALVITYTPASKGQ